jgi:RNA polymerase sigma factor (sigma-70 family)
MAPHPERILQHVRALLPASSPGPATDAALLERYIRDNDEDAFAALVSRHGPMVHGVCRRVLHDRSAAEDVAQAVFLMLARQAKALRRPEALAGWLHQTASRLALNQRRAEGRRLERETRCFLAAPARTAADPLDELSVRELLAIFDEELRRLPERYRLPLILCCLESCTQEEAAHRLGWTPGSVKGRLERGRQRLHDRLVRRGLSLSAALVSLEAVHDGASAAALVAETTRAAVLFASAAGNAETGLAREVVAIAEEGLRSINMTRHRVLFSLLLMIGAVTAGMATVTATQRSVEQPPAQKQTKGPEQPAQKPPARNDRHGDALPEGALTRLGTLRWRTDVEIEALLFTPDGKSVVSFPGFCRFDADGRPSTLFRPTDTRINPRTDRIALSPDGKSLAFAALIRVGPKIGKRVVQVWDLVTGKKAREFDVAPVQWLGWSADGEPLAVLLEKGAVIFRALASGKEKRFVEKDLPDPRYGPTACACVPSAKLLAVADRNRIIHVWDLTTGTKRFTIETKTPYIPGLALSPEGRWLASLSQSTPEKYTVQLWDVATGKVRHTLAADQKNIHSVAFTPDGKTLATVSWLGVRLHDVATGRERCRTAARMSFSQAVAFSPDSKTMVTGETHSGAIHRWDVATAALKSEAVGHTSRPGRAAFAPAGARVLTGGSMDGTMILWDLTTGAPLLQVRRAGWIRACDFSVDGRTFYSSSTANTLDLSDVATGRVLDQLKLSDPNRPNTTQSGLDMRLSTDGKTLVALSSYQSKDPSEDGAGFMLITGWDPTTRKQLFRRRRTHPPLWPVVSPDVKMLAAVAGSEREARELFSPQPPTHVEDLVTGERLLTIPRAGRQSWPQGFSQDGRLLAMMAFGPGPAHRVGGPAGANDQTLLVYELASAGEVLAFPAKLNGRVAFSADGHLLALSGLTDDLVVWDLWRGQERQRFSGLGSSVTSLNFSPDDRLLVSGLANGTLLVWKVAPQQIEGKPAILDAAATTRAWTDLAGDSHKAFAARGALALSPQQALSLLKEHLKAVQPADPVRLRRLLAELDSDTFETREKARKELEELGDRAAGALQEALKRKPSLEAHKRIEALLKRLCPPITDAETLRPLRAVAVLEDIGTPQARKILETLAKGAAEARLTREAKTALARLERQSTTRQKH